MLHITTYDDLAVENQKLDINYASTTLENDDQESMYEVDDIFVEKGNGLIIYTQVYTQVDQNTRQMTMVMKLHHT